MTAWLLTWLWQGTALAAGTAVLLLSARFNASAKHLMWSVVFIVIACVGLPAPLIPNWGLTLLPVRESSPDIMAVAEPVLYIPSAPDFLISIAFGVWAAIAVVNLVRLLPALHAVFALRDQCRVFPATLEAQLPLWLETKNRGRRTQLAMCDRVGGATVLGFHNPCIAIPSSLAEAMTPGELDQIILHEYAHVQRRDDWARLVQSLLFSAIWVHPAAQAVSRAINREREMACDEWVVARTGRPKAYARCLARAAELLESTRIETALLSTFVGRRHELVMRVDRLLTSRAPAHGHVSCAAVTLATLAILMMAVQLQSIRFDEIGSLAIPIGDVQPVQFARWPHRLSEPQTVQPAQGLSQVRLVRHVQSANPTREAAPEVSREAVTPVLEARVFHSLYSLAPVTLTAPIAPIAPIAPVAPNAASAPDRWRLLAQPGVEIATAAKKTGTGVANIVSRAGVSLARSF
jgi:beta-lactamase regulating signal transducer with metallopeptidase domain